MTPDARPRRAAHLLLGLIALCAAAKPVLFDTLDPDCFWHLRVADQIAAAGPRPLVDTLSFASDPAPWTPYSWLAELGMRGLWQAGGYRAAVAAHALLNAAFVVLIAAACKRGMGYRPIQARATNDSSSLGHSGLHGLVARATVLPVALATFVSLPYLSFRPATLAIVLLAAIAALIWRDRAAPRPTRALWLALPLTALLANVHLFAFLVPLWLAALTAGAVIERSGRAKRYALLTVLSAAAACPTPLLPGVIATLVHYQFHDVMVASGRLAEMRPFWAGPMGVASAVIVFLFLATVVRAWRTLSATDWLLLALSTALLMSKGRYAPLFVMMAAPVMARAMGGSRVRNGELRSPAKRSIWSNPALVPALALILIAGAARVIAAFPGATTPLGEFVNRHGPDAPGYPVDAAEFVAASVPPRTGRVLNDFTWGGYLEFRLGPAGFRTLMDGRTQCFPAEFWRAACLADDAALGRLLAAMPADAAVLPRDNARFAGALTRLGWRVAHSDDRAVVMLPPSQAIAGADAGLSSR